MVEPNSPPDAGAAVEAPKRLPVDAAGVWPKRLPDAGAVDVAPPNRDGADVAGAAPKSDGAEPGVDDAGVPKPRRARARARGESVRNLKRAPTGSWLTSKC